MLGLTGLPSAGASHSTGYSNVIPKTQVHSGRVDVMFEPPATWFVNNAGAAMTGQSRYVLYKHQRQADYPGDRSFREVGRYAVSWTKVDGSWEWATYTPPSTPGGVNWTTQTSGTSNMLRGAAYGGSQFVAVGDSGTILTSPDGTTWTSRTSGTANTLYGIAYGGSQFVAVGSGGTILTSPDGANWTSQTSGTANILRGVAYGGGQFVAVGAGGTVLTSPDGTNWTSRSSGTTFTLYGVAYGGGKFVAAGGSGDIWDGVIITSSDGINWSTTYSDDYYSLFGAAHSGSLFAVVGVVNWDNNTGTVRTSPDGTTWTLRDSGTGNTVYGVTYGGDKFVAVGGSGTIITSNDGASWTLRTSGTTNALTGVTYGNETFVAVGASGTILTSSPTTPPASSGTWSIVQPDANSPRYLTFTDTAVSDWEEYYYLVTESSWTGTSDAPPSGPTYSQYFSYLNFEDPRTYVITGAFPPTQSRHGSYTEFTGACTGCHGLHSAKSQEKLLKGPTAADLCATCHDGTGSKYDEANGWVYMGPGRGYAPAPAGPFGEQLKAGVTGRASSVHNIYRQGGPAYARVFQAPGSGFNSQGGGGQVLANGGSGADLSPIGWNNLLSCISCHEPHNRPNNFRLLRNDVNDKGNGDIPVTTLRIDAASTDTTLSVYSTAGFTTAVVSWEGTVIPTDEVDVGGAVATIQSIDPATNTITLTAPLGVSKPAGTIVKARRSAPRVRGISEVNTAGLTAGNELWPKPYADALGGPIGSGTTVRYGQSKFLGDSARFCSQCHRAFYSKTILGISEAIVRRMISSLTDAQVREIVDYWSNQPPLGPPTPRSATTLPANMHGCTNCHVFYYNGVDLRTVGFSDSANPKPIFIGQATGSAGLDQEGGAGGGNVMGEGHRHPTQVPAYRVLISNKTIEGPFSTQQQQEYIPDIVQHRLKDGPVNVGVSLEGTGYVGTQYDGGQTCNWCLKENYQNNDVVCLTCHMAHGSRSDPADSGSWSAWYVGDKRLQTAYDQRVTVDGVVYGLNGLNYETGSGKYFSDYNGNGLKDAGEPYVTLAQSGYYVVSEDANTDGRPDIEEGVTTALARFTPMASVCYRCHSTKSVP